MKNETSNFNKMISLFKRVNCLNEDTNNSEYIDFIDAQKQASEIGDFNDSTLSPEKAFSMLKQFLGKILNKKIILSTTKLNKRFKEIQDGLYNFRKKDSDGNIKHLNKFGYNDPKKAENDSYIYYSLKHTLENKVQNNLMGDVFEGLLMKTKDTAAGPDLPCGIELKTTSINSDKITLFSRNIPENEGDEIAKNINDFLEEISVIDIVDGKEVVKKAIDSQNININFEKNVFPYREEESESKNEYELDFDKNDYIKKEIGKIVDCKGIAAIFYLIITCTDNGFIFLLEADGTRNKAYKQIYEKVIPYEDGSDSSLKSMIEYKLKNVFHVKGKIGTDETTLGLDKYAMFTGYESLILKNNYDLKSLIISGILKPYFRGSFKSIDVETHKEYHDEVNNDDSQKDLFDTTDDEDDESMDNINESNKSKDIITNNGNIIHNRTFDKQYIKQEKLTVLTVRGFVFKISTNRDRLLKLFDIDKK